MKAKKRDMPREPPHNSSFTPSNDNQYISISLTMDRGIPPTPQPLQQEEEEENEEGEDEKEENSNENLPNARRGT